MALPYNPDLKQRAKELRKAGNLSEVLFWNMVKNKQFKGLDFDRQKIIGNYIVDFFCPNCNAVIEIDGSSHDNKQEYDVARDVYLQNLGLTVIHIPDVDIKRRLNEVMEMLYAHSVFNNRTTPPLMQTTPPLMQTTQSLTQTTQTTQSLTRATQTTPSLTRHPSKGGELPGINIKSFKESFLMTGRLDAEYYQPKYEEIIDLVKRQDYDLLGNLVEIKKSIEPGSDVYSEEGLPFIRVSDYNKFDISTPDKCLSDNFCKENLTLLKSLYLKNETILFSKDGSVGTACMVHEDLQAVTSGAILHLTVKDKSTILPEYLTLALNSEVVKMQAERDAGGSIILHWRINEIENVVIPVVSYEIQQEISELISQSFTLRRESEKLLEEAKEMVEREIEDNTC